MRPSRKPQLTHTTQTLSTSQVTSSGSSLFKEDEAIAILANYGQVRNYLHKKTLGRGFYQPRAPSSGGKGSRKGGKGGKGGGSSNARPKQVSRRFLTERSICARCGKTGHWARECKNEPDERGKKRVQGHTFLQNGPAGTGSLGPLPESLSTDFQSLSSHWHGEPPPTLISIESATEPSPQDSSFQFCFTTLQATGGLQPFIGHGITRGRAVVDTGAQHAVVGSERFAEIEEELAAYNLTPRVVPTLNMKALGVGGSTSFIKSAEIPIGIGGVSGLVTIHVLPSDVPLLLPVEFCRKMQCQLFDEGAGGHFSINIFEFPAEGWRKPYEHPNPVRGR